MVAGGNIIYTSLYTSELCRGCRDGTIQVIFQVIVARSPPSEVNIYKGSVKVARLVGQILRPIQVNPKSFVRWQFGVTNSRVGAAERSVAAGPLQLLITQVNLHRDYKVFEFVSPWHPLKM